MIASGPGSVLALQRKEPVRTAAWTIGIDGVGLPALSRGDGYISILL